MLCMLFLCQEKHQYIFTDSACVTLNYLTETAINIGYSCQLLTDEMADIFIIDGHTYDDVESQLGKFREAVRSASLGYGGAPTAATSVSIVTFRWDQHR